MPHALYLGTILTPRRGARVELRADGGLLVDRAGRIVGCGAAAKLRRAFPGARQFHLPAEHLILPGFVDGHTHLPQASIAGRVDGDLLTWLEKEVYPLEARFADREFAVDHAEEFMAELVRTGTTTAAIYSSVHAHATEAAFDAARKAGIRAVIGKVMMDENAPRPLRERTAHSLRDSQRLCRKWNGAADGRLHYAFTPRSALTSSPKLLGAIPALAAQEGARIQTHLSETREEVDAVRARFPTSVSYTDVYRQFGLVRPSTIFAHAIHLDPPEIQILARAGASIAHCPLSNLYLGSGLMDAGPRRARGLRIGLGSDVGAGPTLDMFRQAEAACLTAKIQRLLGPRRLRRRSEEPLVDPETAFSMATLGGADALGFGHETGSLEQGKSADFLVVDFASIDPEARTPRERTVQELLSVLCFRGSSHAVRRVHVRGRRLVPRTKPHRRAGGIPGL